jgi:3-methyladenine DNA glycosylase AlkD
MPSAEEILADLKSKGKEKTRALYSRHGIPIEHTYGVSNADLKLIAKAIKGQQELACRLYESGNYDAMYLAGLVASGAKLSNAQLQEWVEAAAEMPPILEYPIPWLTVEHPMAREIALQWIASPKEHIASAGWRAYTGILSTQPDAALDMAEIEKLLDTVVREIHSAPNRVRACMNSFVISVGIYVRPLEQQAKAAATRIGEVFVDVGDTACEIPLATAYIAKAEAAGRVGVKRKTMRC